MKRQFTVAYLRAIVAQHPINAADATIASAIKRGMLHFPRGVRHKAIKAGIRIHHANRMLFNKIVREK